MKLTSKFQTVATVGFCGSVSRRNENRRAHGAVCHLQARRDGGRIIGRRVNSNGCHQEVGDSFDLDSATLAQWAQIERSSR